MPTDYKPYHKPIKNRYSIKGDCGILTIVRRDGSEYEVFFDREDLERVIANQPWRILPGNGGIRYVCSGGYAHRPLTLLHRLLADTPPHEECDILDGNPFNVRKSNLRNGTHHAVMLTRRRRAEQTSLERGVIWERKGKRWLVVVRIEGENVTVGARKTEAEAVALRDGYLKAMKKGAAEQ